jgi:diguanylate cyclase (GGDEF)-like protein
MTQMTQPSLAESIRLSWWRWQLPQVLEAQFRRETDAERNQRIRWWHGVGVVVNGFNLLLALWSVPELWQLSVLLYFGFVMPILFVSRHLLAAPLPRWQEMAASFLPVLATHLALLTMFALSPAFEFPHSMSLLAMSVIWIGAPIPLRVPEAVLLVALAVLLGGAINVAGGILHDAPFEYPQFVVFSLVVTAMLLVNRLESERRDRQTFLSGLMLRHRTEELEHANAELEVRSHTDALTGLPNRRFFAEWLVTRWEQSALKARPMAALMVDIDHFKNINDTYGHPEGDRCLAAVAQEIARSLRSQQDFVARYGGEEFVVLLEADEAEARALAERTRLRISELVIPGLDHSGTPAVTVSIGVAAMHPALSGANPMALIAAADAALLTAKQSGRNRIVVHTETATVRTGTLAGRPPAVRSPA